MRGPEGLRFHLLPEIGHPQLGLRFSVWGLGSRVWDLEFRVWGLGFRIWGLGCAV